MTGNVITADLTFRESTMASVIAAPTMSVDGFIAHEDDSVGHGGRG